MKTVETQQALDAAIDAGIKAVDLYDIGKEDIILRENLPLAAWLKAQAAALQTL
jgi:hypothetical protein